MQNRDQESARALGPPVPQSGQVVDRVGTPPGPPRRVLGLDLGLRCGWAILETSGRGDVSHVSSGVFLCPTSRSHPGERFARFRDWLVFLLHRSEALAVGYEIVRRHVGTKAAHVYGALRGQLLVSASDSDLALLEVGVGEAKRRIAGKGNASKVEVVEAASRAFDLEVLDDNHADALAVALEALDQAAGWAPRGSS